jgi:Prp8 binding protein
MTLTALASQRQLQKFSGPAAVPKPTFLSSPCFQLSGHSGPVNECEFSPNGSLLASCASELILWSVDSQIESIGALRPHSFPITSLSFSPDSSKIATASADRTVAVQDTETGEIVRRFHDHREIVNTVTFLNPDLLVSGGDDCFVFVHDVRQHNPVSKLRSNSPVTSIATSPTFIGVGGVCGSVFVDRLDNTQLKLVHRLECDALVFGIAIDRGDRYLSAIGADGVLRIFDIQPFGISADRVFSALRSDSVSEEIVPPRLRFSEDGRSLICGSFDGLVRIYDVENVRRPVLKFSLERHVGTVTGVDLHRTLPLFCCGGVDGMVVVGEIVP